MPCEAVVVGSKDTFADAGGIECVAEMRIAFGLLIEVGACPGIAIVAGDHDALPENSGENLSVVAVDA